MSLVISNHALLQFLERTGGLPIEQLRCALAASLDRASSAAEAIRADRYKIVVGGMEYVVRDGVVIAVMFDGPDR